MPKLHPSFLARFEAGTSDDALITSGSVNDSRNDNIYQSTNFENDTTRDNRTSGNDNYGELTSGDGNSVNETQVTICDKSLSRKIVKIFGSVFVVILLM